MHAMMGTECPPELLENQDVMLFINCHCLTNNFLKPKWSDYDKFRYGNTGSALYRVQWSLKDLALMAYLELSSKVVNYPDTLFT